MALLIDVDKVQEEQERQFHRQHISFDTHSPNLLSEVKIIAPESFRASKGVEGYHPDLGAILGLKKALYGVAY